MSQYPLTYDRLLANRNLFGNYTHARAENGDVVDSQYNAEIVELIKNLSGDLRRLERDSQDGGWYTQKIAQHSGVDVESVKKVLKEFFGVAPKIHAWDYPSAPNPHYPGNYGGGINSSLD